MASLAGRARRPQHSSGDALVVFRYLYCQHGVPTLYPPMQRPAIRNMSCTILAFKLDGIDPVHGGVEDSDRLTVALAWPPSPVLPSPRLKERMSSRQELHHDMVLGSAGKPRRAIRPSSRRTRYPAECRTLIMSASRASGVAK